MSRPKPTFSIIIPTLNEEQFIPNLLSDLAAQSFQDFEVLIVDGHSDDKTIKKAQSLTTKLPSIKFINSPKRQVCTQRNLGVKKAGADWLIFMDADNRLPSHFLQSIKHRIESSNADIITTRLQPDVLNRTNLTVSNAMNLFLELQNAYKPYFLLESMIVTTRKCYLSVGGFDESVNYAEGKTFIQNAIKMGYTSQFFRHPVYTYSFRRFRKYGVLGLTARTVTMEIYDLLKLDPHKVKLNNLYPMKGGKSYDESSHAQLLLKLRDRFKTSKSRKKLIEQFTKIISPLLTD